MNGLEAWGPFGVVIGALVSAIMVLWRRLERAHADRRADQRRATKLILALVQQCAELEAKKPPSSPRELAQWDEDESTTVTRAGFNHAVATARQVLDSDIDRLLRAYLQNGHSEPPGSDP